MFFLRKSENDSGIKIRIGYRIWMIIFSIGMGFILNRRIYLFNNCFFRFIIRLFVNNLLKFYYEWEFILGFGNKYRFEEFIFGEVGR